MCSAIANLNFMHDIRVPSACILSAASIQDSAVHICVGQPQTFSCEVPKQGSLTHLEWRIDFKPSSSEESVTQQFTSALLINCFDQ